MRRNVSIVTYHDISEEGSPFTSQLHISTRPEVFRKHVTYFARNFDLISLDDLLADKLPRRPLLLTFDDAYRSVLTVAAPILKEVGAPSVFFIIASVVSRHLLPIDNVLSLATEQLGLSRVLELLNLTAEQSPSVGELLSRYISQTRQDDILAIKARIFSALNTSEQAALKASDRFIGPDDIINLANYRIEVGNHSMTHCYFRSLSNHEVQLEIGESRRVLQELANQPVRSLSVPYGNQLDATCEAMTCARANGHQAIFLGHARSNRFRGRDDTYYRLSLKNENTRKLAMNIRIFPIVRSIYSGIKLTGARRRTA